MPTYSSYDNDKEANGEGKSEELQEMLQVSNTDNDSPQNQYKESSISNDLTVTNEFPMYPSNERGWVKFDSTADLCWDKSFEEVVDIISWNLDRSDTVIYQLHFKDSR